MKRNIQQRPISPLGETSIRAILRKYDPEMDSVPFDKLMINSAQDRHSEMMSHLPIYHQHDGFQLVYMVGGQASFMVDDEIFRLTKGDRFYIPRNLPHAIVGIEEKPEAIVILVLVHACCGRTCSIVGRYGTIKEIKYADT